MVLFKTRITPLPLPLSTPLAGGPRLLAIHRGVVDVLPNLLERSPSIGAGRLGTVELSSFVLADSRSGLRLERSELDERAFGIVFPVRWQDAECALSVAR